MTCERADRNFLPDFLFCFFFFFCFQFETNNTPFCVFFFLFTSSLSPSFHDFLDWTWQSNKYPLILFNLLIFYLPCRGRDITLLWHGFCISF
ncbi:hypothetical protein P170DRAFT_235151 [Aspergillus steynii IBT 23096]|uniref:Uncharacterized protein n=1 Tax=Aspergillus steynii IBT 23096 TaxID=1392250 RepID=A0A2I2G2L9_9EURO|nr:uncharacterized protein P170DRAFT_235151 [Aspergillus steynii IBT 23096]PLB47134.1 hypothetical protein P170DRAFT_235151 [Aspergillus steynii IBT 23096]